MLVARDYRRSKAAKFLDILLDSCVGISVFFVLLALWQCFSEGQNSMILPSANDSIKIAYELLFELDYFSLVRAFFAGILSFLLGVFFAIIAYKFRTFLLLIRPIALLAQSSVPIIWIVLAIFYFGSGTVSVLFVVIVCTFAYSFLSIFEGLKEISQDILDMAKVYEFSKKDYFLHIYCANLAPYFLPALSQSLANGLKLSIMAELFGAAGGIGEMIFEARSVLDATSVMAIMLLCMVFLQIINFVFVRILGAKNDF